MRCVNGNLFYCRDWFEVGRMWATSYSVHNPRLPYSVSPTPRQDGFTTEP